MSLYEKCIAKLITGKKLNFPLVFITKSSFLVPKNIRQNSMHYFIMKTPNKQELQQITFNHLWYIEFKKCLSLYEKVTPKPYSFLVIDATLASCNTLFFRKNIFKRIWKLLITIDDKIRDEKLQCDINREEANISALSSWKNDKYAYLTGEEILSFN